MKKYVMGLDIGGTKSHLAIFDIQGNYIGFAAWGPLNHEYLADGFDQFESELQTFITETLKRYRIKMEELSFSVLGVAGVDNQRQYREVESRLKRIGLSNYFFCNDAYLGIMAALKDGVGICAINGTGGVAVGINRSGEMFQIGGQGDLTDDRGGGTYIGSCAARAVYRALFCRGPRTKLTELIMQAYGVTDKYVYLEEVIRQGEEGVFFPERMNRCVFEAVRQKDPVAEQILLDAADFYSHAIIALVDELQFREEKPLNIVLAGSVFVKGQSQLLLQTIRQTVQQTFPALSAAYILLQSPPVSGAVKRALAEVHGTDALFDKVDQQFKTLSL